MSQGPRPPAADAPADVALEDVRRRERRTLAALGAVVLVVAVVGWLSIPSDAELLARATTHPRTRARIEAMNALAHRGYWEERPTRELQRFLADQPAEVVRFVREQHGPLLNPARDRYLPPAEGAPR